MHHDLKNLSSASFEYGDCEDCGNPTGWKDTKLPDAPHEQKRRCAACRRAYFARARQEKAQGK